MREIFLQGDVRSTTAGDALSCLVDAAFSQLFLVLKYLLQEGGKESENSKG
jgi:hypothetical protein